MRVFVTGGDGRLGSCIVTLLKEGDAHEVISTDEHNLDVTSFDKVCRAISTYSPDLVIHVAAWTDVDGCAREPERAVVVNGLGAGNVAAAAAELGAGVVYISTNEVFDGTRSDGVYREYDPCNPVNAYGYSKYVGEQEVSRLNPKHYIVRTSWLFAHGGKNFMQTMINAAQAGKALRVVTDEVAHPTYTDDLAAAIISLANAGRPGTYHLVNEGAVSRWTFARYILDQAGFKETPIAKISQREWPRASMPPSYTRLANIAGAHLGVTLRPWQDAVNAFLDREGLRVNAV